MTTGPGRPVAAISKAVRIVASSRSGSVTRNTCLATEPMIAETGASWNASVPMTPVGTWPQMTTMGTDRVEDYSHIERYSHVMHLVSTVTGRLADGRTALDAVTACFPAGTLSGAPKVRAMELIEEVEKTRRGLYGGVLGYLDFAGNADFAIAIRTALMRDGVAYVQAGGGVVADSNGPYEFNEAANKAKAVLAAVAAAETLREP